MIERELVEKLKILRFERRLSLDYVAKRLGRSKQWLHRVEKGEIERHQMDFNRYTKVLNVDQSQFPLIYEDKNLVVNVEEGDFKAWEGGVNGGVLKAILSARVIEGEVEERLKNQHNIADVSGYWLMPYLLKFAPNAETKLHSFGPSMRTGIGIEGTIQVYIGMEDDGKIISDPSKFNKKEISTGLSYTLNTGIPHYVVNLSPSEGALLLIFQLITRPFLVEETHKRMWTAAPKDFPPHELISQINSKIVRVIKAKLDPYPHQNVPFHRHSWSEELIIVTQGTLEVFTRSPQHRYDTEVSKRHQVLLQAPAAMHIDGRILRAVRNYSVDETVHYIVAHCVDLNSLPDAVAFCNPQVPKRWTGT